MKRKRIITMLAAGAGAAVMAAAMTASPARADTVPTTTTLTLASNRVVEGFESSFPMSIGVDAGVGSWVIQAGSPTFPTTVLCGGDVATSTTCFMSPGALPPGNYNLIAIYAGNENFSESASDLEPLTVIAQQPTITSLSMSSSTVTVGHEDLQAFSFRVTGDTGNPAQGTVSVLAGSRVLTQCNSIFVSPGGGGVGICGMTASELDPGTYQVTANFDGLGQNFANSTSSPPLTLTVQAPQSTGTSLALSAPTVPFTSQQAETLIATVTATSGTPTGTVTVTEGSRTLCVIGLAGGTGKCILTGLAANPLAPGSYPLTATYNGDNTYAASFDSSQTLTVLKEPTTTSLTLSADTIAVGGERAELFTVQAVPAVSGTPTGNVTVTVNGTAVCTIILASGTGNCSLTARQLARGVYQNVIATYNSDPTFAKSTSSPPQTLTVNRR